MMDSVMCGGVENVFQWAEGANQWRMNPGLVDEIELLVSQAVRGRDQ